MTYQHILRSFPRLPGEVLLEFELPLPRNLTCVICQSVSPVLFRAGCSHSFCGQCRLQLLPSNRTMFLCPIDGIESWAEKMYKDLNVWNIVKDFRVRCNYSALGCGFLDTLEEFAANHQSSCPYHKKTCPLCQEECLSKDLFDHLGSKCAKRPLSCPLCTFNFHRELLQEHMNECPMRKIDCEYCHVKDVLAKDMDAHLDACTLRPWSCTLSEFGCPFKGTCKELLEHLTFEDHVTLINQRFRDIAMTNRDQQEEIAHLNVQLDQLTNIVKDGNRRVATALRSIACALNMHKEENRKLKDRLDEMIIIIGRNTQQLHQQASRRDGRHPCYVEVTTSRPSSGAERGDYRVYHKN
ncbi:TNF receptor-associated factor 6-like isoform X1 [Varroa jacobsoni]|uniref:Uncharacterized protein n=2 Tax=Varroa destructor TaxID=109461 RepID=A0A7M7M926_VARDE|nr:TNF receptor-associated factor 6-like isoform X1 [Varroa destructor]XP_022694104.1 TNF receptor-associated factor 6-like isoform X1 [Varroa jacobsoni]